MPVELPAPALVGGGIAEDVEIVFAGAEGGTGAAETEQDLITGALAPPSAACFCWCVR